MPHLRAFGLISVAVALAAVACGGDTFSPTGKPASTASPASEASGTTRPSPSPTPSEVAPTPTVQSTPSGVRGSFLNVEPTGLVEQDPDFEDGLRSARFSTGGWKTDFSYHTVPFTDFLSGGVPRDGIPPLDNPKFIGIDQADEWLSDLEPVISFELNGVQRAYPLQVLMWHEVVNDVVGGVPVTVTFCPLCNSAIVFERTVNGLVLDFGTSGNLRNSDLVMWDRQTESWWQQLTGEAIVGVMAGTKLKFLPAPIVSWQDFMTHQPDGLVLSKDTGFGRRYGQNPYVGYDRVDNPPFLFTGDLDGRLQPKERVAAITVDGVDAAFPFSTLAQEGAVNYLVNGVDVAVFFKSGTSSALDGALIGSSRDVGSAAVFNAVLEGQKLTFSAAGSGFTDAETGSTWNILGEAIGGPLTGERLTKIVHSDHFWFAWAAFKPDTLIYQGQG
ncbi:MAG: DUF3179 domain-containing protein [Chloroflexi bacterium]|nr:DUF3179 domain-containing protein [Chloroflexota bacterium]